MGNKPLVAGVLIFALALAGAGSARAAKSKKPKVTEEGTWTVKVTPDAPSAAKGEKEFDDTLILHKGKFRSTACEAHGFGEASYRTEENHWMADVASLSEGKNHWHGELTGETVDGQLTWTKPDGTVLNYTFTGTRTGDAPKTKEPAPPKK
jgi:hypothetical protein